MIRGFSFFLLLVFAPFLHAHAQAHSSSDVREWLAKGDALQEQGKYDKAMDAFHKAEKLSRNTCVDCYFRMISLERREGELSSALDDAKRAVKVAGDDKALAGQAHALWGVMLEEQAGKPTDKKLKQADAEFRQALVLAPTLVTAHFDLGFALLREGRDPEGIAELKAYLTAPEADPKTSERARRLIAEPIRAREPILPEFSITTLEGATITDGALRGKVVLLDFWGTWCPPCRASIPTLQDIHKKFADRSVEIVGISSDQNEQAWRTFVAAHHMDWPEYIDLSNKILELFEVREFPTYLVVDRAGIIQFREAGYSNDTYADLEDAISRALKKPYVAQPPKAPSP